MAQPQTEQVLAQVGSTGGGGFGGGGASDLREGTMTVILHHDRDLTTDDFQQKPTQLTNDVPAVRFFNSSGFGSAAISVVLAGEDGHGLARDQPTRSEERRVWRE